MCKDHYEPFKSQATEAGQFADYLRYVYGLNGRALDIFLGESGLNE